MSEVLETVVVPTDVTEVGDRWLEVEIPLKGVFDVAVQEMLPPSEVDDLKSAQGLVVVMPEDPEVTVYEEGVSYVELGDQSPEGNYPVLDIVHG